ncbi:MAG: low temperature requirement protein A [Anaerolineae bacterium]|jgi:low temperature requirement protein LtrA|nr:low temperature requirement protein A [Anaerolineae bacterium]
MAHHPPVYQPPQLHIGERESQRKVTWTELFYDLVFVATLVQLGNFLSDQVNLTGFFTFVLLFVPVWWAWIGTTFYANRFDSDDVIHRLLVFGQIFCVSLMAIHINPEIPDNTARFALAYAAQRAILVAMYLRAGQHILGARVLIDRYVRGFGLAALMWAISALFPEPIRYGIWLIAFLIDVGTPLTSIPQQLQLPPSPNHLPERFALFTIIVLGEGFLKVIGGVAGQTLTISDILLDMPGLIIPGVIWWIYFDNVAETAFQINRFRAQVWLYTHFPLHLSITALGVGIYKLVTTDVSQTLPDNYRWLICGTAALSILAIGVIEWAIAKQWDKRVRNELVLRVGGAIAIGWLAIFGGGFNATLLMILLGLIGAVIVGMDLYWRAQLMQQNAH